MSELQDSVEHELSVAVLQLMSGGAAPAGDDRQGQLVGRVSETLDLALSELRLLARVARTDSSPTDHAQVTRPRDLYRVTTEWSELLRRAGFDATFSIPVSTQRLAGSVRLTLLQALDTVCAAMVEHAWPGSRCVLTVRLPARGAELEVRITMPAAAACQFDAAIDLVALSQRTEMIDGRIRAGTGATGAGSEWSLLLTLPSATSGRP